MGQRSAEDLAEEAKGEFGAEILKKTKRDGTTLLYNKPLIDHLNVGEQPEYVLNNSNQGFRIILPDGSEETPHHNSDGSKYLLITDQRILYVAGCSGGDERIEIEYSDIVDVRVEEGTFGGISRYITVSDRPRGDVVYKFYEDINPFDYEMTPEEYIRKQTSTDDLRNEDTTNERLSNIDIDDIRNDDIPNYMSKIDNSIKPDETVYYAYSINAAERGDDHMGGLTTGGCLLATDRRLTAYINETIGSSNLSIGYNKIDTVEIEHGAMVTKLSVQSTSKTYSFPGFNSLDKSEIHDFADFIRDQADGPETNERSGSTTSPTEKLRELKELHEEGILSDEEFQSKKEDLLDDF